MAQLSMTLNDLQGSYHLLYVTAERRLLLLTKQEVIGVFHIFTSHLIKL